jgi:hypothetical protein
MKRLAYAFALTLILITTAAAQGTPKLDDSDSDQRPVVYYSSLIEGVETSPGVASADGAAITGTTYTVDVSGTLAGHFTAVVDSTSPDPQAEQFVNDVLPQNENQIVRGTWTMAVYQDGAYRGTLFGEITGGRISWTYGKMTNSGTVRAELTIKGGTKGMADVTAGQTLGAFEVLWESNPEGSNDAASPTLNGRLDLAF